MAARKLVIDVEVDDSGAVRALRNVEGGIRGVTTEASTGGRALSALTGFLSHAASAFVGFVSAQVVMRGLSESFRFAKEAAFGMNATLETTQLQFETLMGSSSRAREKVAELFEFAKTTPFETEPIIEASRKLETFGGAALNTMGNLRLIGDAAAATGAPINELGFWVGRLYAQLQAGQPFGEASMRLTELAVLSPKARLEMEALAKSGGSAKDVFAVFQGSLERFTGAMEQQAGTWKGVTSTFVDSAKIMIAEATRPLFEAFRDLLGMANRAMGSEGVQGFVEQMTNAIAQRMPAASTIVIEFLGVLTSLARGFELVHNLAQFMAIGLDRGAQAVANIALMWVRASQEAVKLQMIMDPLGLAFETHRAQLDQLAIVEADLNTAVRNLQQSQMDHLGTMEAMSLRVGQFEADISLAQQAVLNMAHATTVLESRQISLGTVMQRVIPLVKGLAGIWLGMPLNEAPTPSFFLGEGVGAPGANFGVTGGPGGSSAAGGGRGPGPGGGAFGMPAGGGIGGFPFTLSPTDLFGRPQISPFLTGAPRTNAITVQVNAQGAVFEDTASLDRLADLIARKIGSQLGRQTALGLT